jgi:toxin ParE1/3/4
MLTLRRADDFVGDFDHAYRWYFDQAGEAIARRFLESVWHTLELLAEQPGLGAARRFRHAELEGLRSFRVRPTFQAHLIFYRYTDRELSVERLLHGRRDLPRRLLEPPGPQDR